MDALAGVNAAELMKLLGLSSDDFLHAPGVPIAFILMFMTRSHQSTSVRPPVVAGMFYPAEPDECRESAAALFRGIPSTQGETRWFGALVPHAGWVCSGRVAAHAISALRQQIPKPDVIIVFGAVHTVGGLNHAALDDHRVWEVPSGDADVAADLQEKILAASRQIVVDPRVHRREHAIEVELPLIEQAWPGVPILPIEVPPFEQAVAIGEQTARVMEQAKRTAVYLASSDLTHYGPNYDFAPAGLGMAGVRWAMGNDQRLLDLIQDMQADRIVPETEQNLNACGGGAIAAMLAACAAVGATRANVLEHTNSYEVLSRTFRRETADNAVGYAAAVIG